MTCQCCGSDRDVLVSVLTGREEATCYRCWRWLCLLFVRQPLAADKWIRDTQEG
jgi:hypothetical protein